MQQAVDRRAVATDNARPDPRRPAAFLCGMVTFVALDHTVPAATLRTRIVTKPCDLVKVTWYSSSFGKFTDIYTHSDQITAPAF